MDGCIRCSLECNIECFNGGKEVVEKEQVQFRFITEQIIYRLYLPTFFSIRLTVTI